MSVNGAGANANGATIESTVEDSGEQGRGVSVDNLVRNEQVRNK
jgi:hypothetical protein